MLGAGVLRVTGHPVGTEQKLGALGLWVPALGLIETIL